MKVKIKYHADIPPISPSHRGEWIDLRASKEYQIDKGDYGLINLGVSMELPDGYEAIMIPRSSTFKYTGLIQANSCALIDNLYKGDNDVWHWPFYATRHTIIEKDQRICQFRIQKTQPDIEFEEVGTLGNGSRGGFGSTGVK